MSMFFGQISDHWTVNAEKWAVAIDRANRAVAADNLRVRMVSEVVASYGPSTPRWEPREPKASPVVARRTPGRNELCHCGSGVKFKRCHGK